ncbi:hypothetical protein AAF712_010047 [Marasmius tenuissimus]|uniref:Uncharacterized protein n=1 Tax=Marasmius tenuissimus TaxID=585030 RepID=A0ABR2ZQ47_9AGAR
MELNDEIVKTVMTTVASFRNVKSLTVVNQRVLAGDLFRMVNRKDLSSLALSWVIFDQIPTIDASTLWDSDGLVHPASPAKLSLLGVGWNPVNDPDMLLPRMAASENLLEFTLDLCSFLQLRRGFSQAGETLGRNIQSFELMPSRWVPGVDLNSGVMAQLRDFISLSASSLHTVNVHVASLDTFLGGKLDMASLEFWRGPEGLLPMLGVCPLLVRLSVRSGPYAERPLSVIEGCWPKVHELWIERWSGNMGLIDNIIRCVDNVEVIHLECLPQINSDDLLPLGWCVSNFEALQVITISFLGDGVSKNRDLGMLETEWGRIWDACIRVEWVVTA